LFLWDNGTGGDPRSLKIRKILFEFILNATTVDQCQGIIYRWGAILPAEHRYIKATTERVER
jgi:hypothetical protein